MNNGGNTNTIPILGIFGIIFLLIGLTTLRNSNLPVYVQIWRESTLSKIGIFFLMCYLYTVYF